MTPRQLLIWSIVAAIFLGALIWVNEVGAPKYYAYINTARWTEAVRLSDGQTIPVVRVHRFNNQYGLGTASLSFTVPGTEKRIVWTGDFGRGLQDNVVPVALDIVNAVPYLVTYPMNCYGYIRWDRPNPPYVFFAYENAAWKRIQANAYPQRINEANLLITANRRKKDLYLWFKTAKVTKTEQGGWDISVAKIRKMNSTAYRFMNRFVYTKTDKDRLAVCPYWEFYKGAWIGRGSSFGRELIEHSRLNNDQ
jgi:hypothetical protein